MSMLPFIAALLFGAADAAVATDVQAANLPGVFEATCLDGQARLSAGDVTPISFDELPSDLRERLGLPASANIWRLNTPGRSYLYVLNYDAGPGISPKICGLASDAMDFNTASDALAARVAGGVERNQLRTTQWLNAQDGYIATATTAAKFNVLQINWMNEADRAAAPAQVEQLHH
jgi:hypothetical protein